MRKIGHISVLRENENCDLKLYLTETNGKIDSVVWYCEVTESFKKNKMYVNDTKLAQIFIESHEAFVCITKNNWNVNKVESLTEMNMVSQLKRLLPQQEICIIEKNNTQNYFKIK